MMPVNCVSFLCLIFGFYERKLLLLLILLPLPPSGVTAVLHKQFPNTELIISEVF